MKQYVIVVGDLGFGIQTIHGPFEDRELANQWASVNVGNQSYTIEVLTNTGYIPDNQIRW